MTDRLEYTQPERALETDEAYARRVMRASRSKNTRRAYAGAWARFAEWRGSAALPVGPMTVGRYLEHLAAGKAVATVRLAASAIADRHREAGHPDPTSAEIVRRQLQAIARQKRVAQPHMARPITNDEWAVVQGYFAPHETPAARFDLALMWLMRDCSLRVSEAGALTWGDVQGCTLYIAQSKTDQKGEGERKAFGVGAAGALMDHRAMSADTGPGDRIFPLSNRQLRHRIAVALAAAGLGPGYSSHSFRIGTTVQMGRAGATLVQMQQQGRWKSARMPARYAAAELAERSAALPILYDDDDGT